MMELLGKVLKLRKDFITIDNSTEYKRCRVQSHRKGVVLRDEVKGVAINTKRQQLCRENDFIVAEIDAKVGGYGFIPAELDGAIVSSHYFLFEVNEELMLRDYLHWLIKTAIIQDQINSKGSTNYAAIRPNDVLGFKIPLPRIDEQRAIIARLTNIGTKMNNLTDEIESQSNYLQLLRQALLQDAIQGKLVPQDPNDEPASELLKRIKAQKEKLINEGKIKKEKPLPPISEDEVPFELPKGWVWCRLGEVAYVGNGSTPDKSQFTTSGDDMPYLKVYNIVNQNVDFNYKPQYIKRECHTGQLKRSMCFSGDVIMNIVGPPLGKIAIIPEQIPECNINQAIVIMRSFVRDLNKWIYWYLCEKTAVNSIVTKGTAGQDNISVTQSRNLPIPIPPLKEQVKIIFQIQGFLALLAELETQSTQSKTNAELLLQAVLREAFEGRESTTPASGHPS